MTTQTIPATLQPIPGFPDYYVGDDGTLWSDARGHRRLLRQAKHSAGYRVVGLRRWDQRKRGGKVTVLFVHRLVLTAFVGPCPPGMECRHLDGDRANNNLTNLAWGTHAENEADRHLHGRVPHGESHVHAKLTNERVAQLRADVNGGMSLAAAARAYGVSEATVSKAVKRETWRHV